VVAVRLELAQVHRRQVELEDPEEVVTQQDQELNLGKVILRQYHIKLAIAVAQD
jgi:hypothetical protein